MKHIKNFIFDWSGTVSDDLHLVHAAAMHVFRAYDMPEISLEEFRREFEYPYMPFYHKYNTDITQEMANQVYLKVIHEVGEPIVYPGADDVLAQLHRRERNMVVFSGIPQPKLEKEVDDYGFRDYFSEVNGDIYDKRNDILALLERNRFESQMRQPLSEISITT